MASLSPAIWPLDELLAMDDAEFDEVVHETRRHVEGMKTNLRTLDAREEQYGMDVEATRERYREILDDEIRNLQRMAFADSARQGRGMI